MHKREFGVLIREARSEKQLSLRRLASLAGVDYSRLARIEQGSRPAPGLGAIRALAGPLDLDLAELLVAAGTARSVVEDLAWSERIHLGREGRLAGAAPPPSARLLSRNTFEGRVVERDGALCTVRVGRTDLRALSFADTARLRLVIPPETVAVVEQAPRGLPEAAATLLACRVIKARPIGQLVNHVLAAEGLELNALAAARHPASCPKPGDRVVAVVLTAAVQTTPLKEESCGASQRDS